ncbi:MAG: phosphatase PAP2 family protein [Candidatus Anstonellales archaeon]
MSFYLSFHFVSSKSNFLKYFALLFSSTVLIPLIYFLIKRKRGEIINRDAVIKEERNDVYLFSIFIFSFAYIISVLIQSPIFIEIYLLNFTLSTIGVLFINKKFKISIHSMTSAGTSAFLILIDPMLSLVIFIITLIIMWSRVTLGVHSLKEVMYGMIYGFCVTLFVIILVLSYAT